MLKDDAGDGELLRQLERRMANGEIGRRGFLRLAGALGVQAALAVTLADRVAAASINPPARGIAAGYDYIVVGAGSAGSVVASRLAEDPARRVLLVEAGSGNIERPTLSSPFSWPANLGSDVDWCYKTVPQAHAQNRVFNYPRGKVVGGSSSINAMIWVWGHASDFDNWEKAGCTGWGFDQVKTVFQKIETCGRKAPAGTRGTQGPMHVGPMAVSSPMNEAFLEACKRQGLGVVPDINAPLQEGTGLMDLSVRDGKRFSVVHGYLLPGLKRDNLTLVTDARVDKLLFEGTRCVGVRLVINGQVRDVRAEQETIVSAGAIDSPRLLMLSGIGPAADLRSVGIAPLVDLPGVGQNLQDHVALPSFVAETWEKGVPGSRLDTHAFFRTDSSSPVIDAQALFIPGVLPPSTLKRDEGYTLWAGLVRPRSRGRVKLLSGEPGGPLHIDPAYLSDPTDLRALMQAAQWCRDIGNSAALASVRKRVHFQPPATRGELAEFVSRSIDSYWHPTSTCAMGVGELAVVSPSLQVRGVSQLRVADASIMPSITSANTNAPSIMIGEKAAQNLIGA
ncbi:GMC family oxidoreductase [Caenimonas soli]|uniref:GMC family oxidoreductase n=1 Tax=Caenimonas soli TaxID=2735555 RepID=UPI0015542E37|nr:GMC family oxidoreductase N-terminal domain-containing protein [Caenimonas soli]NPC57430.1 hypothetical protein [Caenimonas soli]